VVGDTAVIRDERASDQIEISEVTAASFEDVEVSDHTEQFIIESLRDAGALTISLVAELDGSVVGHIAFSPVTMSDGTGDWYGLGPVSVRPDCQRKGIGKALIRVGLERLQSIGAKGCCLVGHPTYYRQFGFENTQSLVYEGVPPEVFFVLAFSGNVPQGRVIFHKAFLATGDENQ
jgi:putative acetyltransferase